MRQPAQHHSPKPVRLAFLLAVATLLGLLASRVHRRPPTASPSTPPSLPIAAAIEPEIMRAFLALEASEAEADRVTWPPERLAQLHGATIDDLWDALNRHPDRATVVREIPFLTLTAPAEFTPQALRPSIQQWIPSDTTRLLTSTDWPRQLDSWIADRWRLEQSEWRHVRFVPPTPVTSASSEVELHLHLTSDHPVARAQLTARLSIQWPSTPPETRPAHFGNLVIDRVNLLSIEGPTPFRLSTVFEIEPFPKTSWIDPIIIRESGHPGRNLPEILLAARNLVLRRDRHGTWSQHPLSPHHPGLVFTALLGDFDSDGIEDLLFAVRSGLQLLRGAPDGTFPHPPDVAWAAPERLHYVQAFTCGDINGDGRLDVFLGQYRPPYERGQMPRPFWDARDGPPAFLLVNQGDGRFTDLTDSSGLLPKRHRRSYGASLVDLDEDLDLDLLVTSDFAGMDVYENDGHGRFTDRTDTWIDQPVALGMSHLATDFDSDARLDLLLVGMPQATAARLDALELERPGYETWKPWRSAITFGNRLFYGAPTGYRERPVGADVARAGWAWGAVAPDIDLDGFPDLLLVNGHETGPSVRDYEPEFWTHDIYAGDSTPRPEVDAYFGGKFAIHRARGGSYGGHHKNRLFLNLQGRAFVDVGHLLGLALESDSRNAVADDFDGDGDPDLLVSTFEIWPKRRQTVRIYENQFVPQGDWIGLRLLTSTDHQSPLGAHIVLETAAGSQTRKALTGDGYRSQHACRFLFGVHPGASILRLTVSWPDGQRTEVRQPGVRTWLALQRPPRSPKR